MKSLRALTLRVATGAAIALGVAVAQAIVARLEIPARIVVGDDGCIFHKPRSQWTEDDIDLLERRIRRLQAMPDGREQSSPD